MAQRTGKIVVVVHNSSSQVFQPNSQNAVSSSGNKLWSGMSSWRKLLMFYLDLLHLIQLTVGKLIPADELC